MPFSAGKRSRCSTGPCATGRRRARRGRARAPAPPHVPQGEGQGGRQASHLVALGAPRGGGFGGGGDHFFASRGCYRGGLGKGGPLRRGYPISPRGRAARDRRRNRP